MLKMYSTVVAFVLLVLVSYASAKPSNAAQFLQSLDEDTTEFAVTETTPAVIRTLPPAPPSQTGKETSIILHPYQGALFISKRFAGSCSIISEDFALATSVYLFGIFPLDVSVKVGATNVYTDGEIVLISEFYTHPKYAYTADYDIALLQFDRKLTFSATIQPISLALLSPPAGTSVIVSGWGEGIANHSWALHETELQIIDSTICNETTHGEVTDRIICAGSKTVFVCDHDIGDPIIYNNTLVGMYIGGYGSCRPDNILYSQISSYSTYLPKLIAEIRSASPETSSS